MVNYFNYDDLSITLKPTGKITFNKELIYRKMSKDFVMPQWIESDVDKILDDKIFEGVTDTESIMKIINSKVLELNNTLVPIARANNLKNSAIAHHINFEKYFEPEDIVLLASGLSHKSNEFMDKMIIDIEHVFKKLSAKGFNLDDDQKDELVDRLNTELLGMETEYSFWNVIKNDRIEKMMGEIKAKLSKHINEFLLDHSTPIILKYLLDNVAVEPYFSYNNKTREVEYDEKRVFYLLDAMGYHVFGSEDTFRIYLFTHKDEVEREINETDFSDISDEAVNNLTLYVNLSILNRIKFISDNNIPLEAVSELRYPEVLTSQLELEQVYMDRCADMMSHDKVLEDLALTTGLPKHKVDKYIDYIINECENTFKLLKDKNAPIENLYRGVSDAYSYTLNIAVKKANKDFTKINSNSYSSTSSYGSYIMNNINNN